MATKDRLALVEPANYDQHLPLLAECDLVIEAIAEKLEWKEDLYAKIAPHLKPGTIVASNTSGLSINKLAQAMPADASARTSAASTSSTRRAT